jgi:hypothetical protein
VALMTLPAASCSSPNRAEPTPPCTPRTGVGAFGEYPEAALPSGACSSEPVCEMSARESCHCPHSSSSVGPYNHYRCSCVAGQWSCQITLPGGSACDCGLFDSGASDVSVADASESGGADAAAE